MGWVDQIAIFVLTEPRLYLLVVTDECCGRWELLCDGDNGNLLCDLQPVCSMKEDKSNVILKHYPEY